MTSAQAAAHLLRVQHGEGARIAVLGAAGLEAALVEAGLTSVHVDDERAVGIVSGYGPDVVWRDVMRAAVRIRDGLPWVASNTDLTLPTAAGPAPGHGVLVDMLSRFSGVEPVVAGKPRRPLLDETIRRVRGDLPDVRLDLLHRPDGVHLVGDGDADRQLALVPHRPVLFDRAG